MAWVVDSHSDARSDYCSRLYWLFNGAEEAEQRKRKMGSIKSADIPIASLIGMLCPPCNLWSEIPFEIKSDYDSFMRYSPAEVMNSSSSRDFPLSPGFLFHFTPLRGFKPRSFSFRGIFPIPVLLPFIQFLVVSLFHRLEREDVNRVCYANFMMLLEQYRMHMYGWRMGQKNKSLR